MIVLYRDALYVSAHPLATHSEPFGPRDAPRGVYRVVLGRDGSVGAPERIAGGAAPRVLAVDDVFVADISGMTAFHRRSKSLA